MSDTPFSRMVLIFISVLDHFLKWTALICGGATLTFMTGFSVWNVLIMRKAMNAPITGAEDLLLLALVAIVALSIPLGARTGAHIEIEILESRMSVLFAKWSMIFIKTLRCVNAWVYGMAALACWWNGKQVRRDNTTITNFIRTVLLPTFSVNFDLRSRFSARYLANSTSHKK